jgi:hypothetical protein
MAGPWLFRNTSVERNWIVEKYYRIYSIPPATFFCHLLMEPVDTPDRRGCAVAVAT